MDEASFKIPPMNCCLKQPYNVELEFGLRIED